MQNSERVEKTKQETPKAKMRLQHFEGVEGKISNRKNEIGIFWWGKIRLWFTKGCLGENKTVKHRKKWGTMRRVGKTRLQYSKDWETQLQYKKKKKKKKKKKSFRRVTQIEWGSGRKQDAKKRRLRIWVGKMRLQDTDGWVGKKKRQEAEGNKKAKIF